MRKIEFETQVENGTIIIPKNFNESLNNKNVKILIMVNSDADVQVNYSLSKIENILKKINSKGIFSNIEDPVIWQKKLRDEWK